MSLIDDVDDAMSDSRTISDSRTVDSNALAGVSLAPRPVDPCTVDPRPTDLRAVDPRPTSTRPTSTQPTSTQRTDGGVATPLRRHVTRNLTGVTPIDREAGQRAVSALLEALGRDPSSPHLADTPRRVIDALAELTTPEDFDLTTFPNDEHYDEMVVEVGIPIHSLCEHHMLPFVGEAHIAYIPRDRILGISKLARVARMFARDLQVQERLTAQIADWLRDNLDPRGVGVVVEAEHMCQSLRGVKAPGTRTVTSALRGVMRSDPRTREEFLSLTRRSSR